MLEDSSRVNPHSQLVAAAERHAVFPRPEASADQLPSGSGAQVAGRGFRNTLMTSQKPVNATQSALLAKRMTSGWLKLSRPS